MVGEGDMVEIGEALQEFLLSEGMEDLGELMRIQEVWADVAGEKIAGETKPYRLEGEKLYVGVRSHAWAQELHYLKEDIKNGIRERTGIEIGEIIIKKVNVK